MTTKESKLELIKTNFGNFISIDYMCDLIDELSDDNTKKFNDNYQFRRGVNSAFNALKTKLNEWKQQ